MKEIKNINKVKNLKEGEFILFSYPTDRRMALFEIREIKIIRIKHRAKIHKEYKLIGDIYLFFGRYVCFKGLSFHAVRDVFGKGYKIYRLNEEEQQKYKEKLFLEVL